jgi:hypothetical protein
MLCYPKSLLLKNLALFENARWSSRDGRNGSDALGVGIMDHNHLIFIAEVLYDALCENIKGSPK